MEFKSNKKIFFLIVFILFISLFSKIVFAVWNGNPYTPGAVDNPECLPSQTNCDVLPALTAESDPIFIASQAFTISASDISKWKDTYSWGNHANAGYVTGTPWTSMGYLTSFTEMDPIFNTWLSTTPPLYSFTETDQIFSAWNKSTGISITESQISDLQKYLTSYTETDPIYSVSQAHNITSTDITNLGNLSGTNSGDETNTSIKNKLGISILSGSNTGDQDLSGLVPYSGGTTDVNLGAHNITATTFIGSLTGTASSNEVPLTFSNGLTRTSNEIKNNLITGTTGAQTILGSTGGNGLVVDAGRATQGGANQAGGDLTLKSGISTGTGTSALHFFTATAGTTGTADRTPTEKMTILGNGNVGIGTTTPAFPLVVSYGANRGETIRIYGANNTYNGGIGIGSGSNNFGTSIYYGGTQISRFESNGGLIVGVQDNQGAPANGILSNGNIYALGSVGIGTTAPTANLSFGNTADKTINIVSTDTTTDGKNLNLVAGSTTGGSPTADFLPLGQTSRGWQGMTATSNGNVYAASQNQDIYMQTNGTGNFVALSQGSKDWQGMTAAPNGNVYIVTRNGDIYMQTNGTGNFVALGQTSREWRAMAAAPNGNVYATGYSIDIYMQTNGTGTFNALSQTLRGYTGMTTTSNGNVYACVDSGDIYMQTNGTGNFVALGQTSRRWWGMTTAPNGNVYAGTMGGDIYMQTGGTGNFVALSQTSRNWYSFAASPVTGNVYAGIYGGDIYMQTNDPTASSDKAGGSLILSSGAGKGTGASNIIFNTGTTLTTGTTLQTLSEKMRLTGSGNLGIGLTSPTAYLNIKAGTATAGTAPIKLTSGTLNTTAEAGAIEFNTDAYYGTITTGASRKNFIQNNLGFTGGQTLIGGTAVTDKLVLQGTTGNGTLTSPAIQMNVGNAGGTTALTVLNNGNVGIGTTTPNTARLEVVGNYGGAFSVASNDTGVTGNYSLNIVNTDTTVNNRSNIWFGDNVASASATIGAVHINHTSDYADLSFATRGTDGFLDRMRILSNGNVGIGTTSPSTKLEIGSSDLGDGVAGPIITIGRNTNATNTGAGSINFLDKAGNSGYIWQDAAGYMRINTSAPSNANDTAGTIIGDQTSIRETKQDINDYEDYESALSMIVNAPLHTFRYIKEVNGYGADSLLAKTRIGFIADEVDPMFMVGNSIDQVSVNGLLMASIKEMNLKLESLAVPIDENNIKSFIERFYEKLTAWLGSPDNGIEKICVKKSDGTSFCVNGDQLEQAVNGMSATTTPPPSTVTPVETAPVVEPSTVEPAQTETPAVTEPVITAPDTTPTTTTPESTTSEQPTL